MRTENVLIVGREDLIDSAKDKDISRFKMSDFSKTIGDSIKLFARQNMIVFIDNNGETTVLKNRWGDSGKIVRRKKWLYMMSKATKANIAFILTE